MHNTATLLSWNLHWIVPALLCYSLARRFVPFLRDPRIRESEEDEGKHIFYGNVSSTLRHIRPRIDKPENIIQLLFLRKRHFFLIKTAVALSGSRSGGFGNFCSSDKSWNYASTCLIRLSFMLMMPCSFGDYNINTTNSSVASKQCYTVHFILAEKHVHHGQDFDHHSGLWRGCIYLAERNIRHPAGDQSEAGRRRILLSGYSQSIFLSSLQAQFTSTQVQGKSTDICI